MNLIYLNQYKRKDSLLCPDKEEVSVIALGTAVFHYHNPFQRHYQKYRQDVEKDREYISQKRISELQK